MAFKKDLTPKSENLSDWYNQIVLKAELADYGPAKGTMIFRPYGYGIWELVQKEFDARIKEHGVENAYFPLFIPESFLKREEKHVEGFSPELAVVTIGGGEELEEKLVVRPTSETIMYDAFSRWVHSWRDLPLKVNQWNNVVRWEKRTYLFLRTTEFLWQEGHTAHAMHNEASELQHWAMEEYARLYKEFFAIPGYVGRKSESEKFAGADMTLTYETLMPEGKALQSCTSHDLGQNFSKAFDITFQDKSGNKEYAWQTSWGLSTRSIGGLIMTHGDDKGLILPPRLAPVQVVILPVKPNDEAVLTECRALKEKLKTVGIRSIVDDADETIGFRINKWELKGVPLRIELGQKEIESGQATVARRDIGEKESLPLTELDTKLHVLLDDVQKNLLEKAERFLKDNTHVVDSYEEFKNILETKRGFLKALWCEDSACEAVLKKETKASTRCLPIDAPKEEGKCIRCDKPANYRWIFAQAY
jgi:prolyl-tRNA synthetase